MSNQINTIKGQSKFLKRSSFSQMNNTSSNKLRFSRNSISQMNISKKKRFNGNGFLYKRKNLLQLKFALKQSQRMSISGCSQKSNSKDLPVSTQGGGESQFLNPKKPRQISKVNICLKKAAQTKRQALSLVPPIMRNSSSKKLFFKAASCPQSTKASGKPSLRFIRQPSTSPKKRRYEQLNRSLHIPMKAFSINRGGSPSRKKGSPMSRRLLKRTKRRFNHDGDRTIKLQKSTNKWTSLGRIAENTSFKGGPHACFELAPHLSVFSKKYFDDSDKAKAELLFQF